MSEQQTEQMSGEGGSLDSASTVPAPSDPLIASVMASAREAAHAEPAMISPDHEAVPKEDAPKIEPPKIEAPKVEAPKVEAVKLDAPRETGKVLIMSPGNRAWHEEPEQPRHAEFKASQAEPFSAAPRQRLGGMAAVVALAMIAGAVSGALATAGLTHVADAATTTAGNGAASGNGALETAIARIDADIVALKAGLEHTSKTGLSQFNKTSDRLDKIEKAQAEPAAKLAKLSEAVDKLRTTQAAAPAAPAVVAAATPASAPPAAAAAPKDVTGTVTTPAGAAALPTPGTPPKSEVARLPTVEGWVLRDVGHGGALIEGRHGLYEVYAGDPVPGLGRIDAIRKQDGRWVVVTSRGLVVSR